MKTPIYKITNLTYTLTSANQAMLHAEGEVTTSGWTEPALANPRIGDGILHLDFVAKRPDGQVLEVISPIATKHALPLGPQPQEVTVHSASNEMSVRLPAVGDPA